MFVARGQGLIAVIKPIKKAAIKGKLFIDIASIKDIKAIFYPLS
jgi:hypothetical protein